MPYLSASLDENQALTSRIFAPCPWKSQTPGRLQDVKLDVTFEPTETNPDIRVEHVRLMLDGCDDQFLTMTGACVEQEAQPEKLNFQVAVREVQEKTINVKNPSASDWLLRPVIHNDAWSGAEFLTVPAGKQQAYTIKYQPMRMAEAASPHTGSVFFPLPNGLGLLYQLTGTAGAPSRSGEIKVTAPAKQAHHELVKVSNWDKHNQRFAVNIELANRPKACVCDAPEYIDVPGLAERDLRLTLSNQLEGSVSGRVVCTNTTTGEYLFYDLSFVTTAPLPQAPLVLECPVRQKARAAARVHNPLPDPVTLDVKCSDPMVEVPAKVEVPGKSTGEVTGECPIGFNSHTTLNT